jgi:TRAP-type uncharacterized transport system substrate-binding protein
MNVPAPRRSLLAMLAAASVLLLAAWIFVALGSPPRVVTMATGPAGGSAAALGERYRELLAQSGVDLRLVPSAGDADNLDRLRDPASGVSAGFVIGGLPGAEKAKGVESLGTIGFEPMWVFLRAGLRGASRETLARARVSLDLPGSGTRALAGGILALNGLDPRGFERLDLAPAEAAERLIRGDLDAVVMVAEWNAPAVQRLISAPEVWLLGPPRADALVALNPYLTKLVLPAGVGDLATNRPPEDVVLVAPKASLVVRGDLHEAVQYLLLDATTRLRARPGIFHKAGAFPAPEAIDFPLSDEAARYYRSGRPFLQRYLPFWVAVRLERLLLILIPVIGLLLPIANGAAGAFRAFVEQRVTALYSELTAVEAAIESMPEGEAHAALLQRLDELALRARRLRIPLQFSPMRYALVDHIRLVRERLEG